MQNTIEYGQNTASLIHNVLLQIRLMNVGIENRQDKDSVNDTSFAYSHCFQSIATLHFKQHVLWSIQATPQLLLL